jgi:hypothetical protein
VIGGGVGGLGGVCIHRQFIEDLLRYVQALDSKCLEVNFTSEHAPLQVVPPPPLDEMHGDRCATDCDDKYGQHDDKENPQAR